MVATRSVKLMRWNMSGPPARPAAETKAVFGVGEGAVIGPDKLAGVDFDAAENAG